jgi:hypothetical protein
MDKLSDVLFNKDLITIISAFADTAAQYKTMIATCTFWYDAVKSPQREHKYMNVISTLIMRYRDLDWGALSMSYVTMEVVTMFVNNKGMYWHGFSTNPRLTREFIVKHVKKLETHYLITNRAMSCSDIEWLLKKQSGKRLLWYTSSNPNLTSEFIEKYRSQLNSHALYQNPCLSLKYIQECMLQCIHVDGKNLDFNMLLLQPNLTTKFIRENRNKFDDRINRHPAVTVEMLEERCMVNSWWCNNPNITGDFIENHMDTVNWDMLSQNRALTMILIEKYIDNIVWMVVWKNPNVTIEFMEVNLARFKCILY